ncbi:MAG TPA: PAAR domain-containing protein [Candidatus Limnocylindrales bacterium]|nr:PAAR domain-containing protein [Candidatus Limnocylindrales bacterium]
MGNPAIVMGDKINGICPSHLIPSASGTAPAGPLPFSAPITLGTVPTVVIGGKAAAVVGSSGYNTPPHAGIVDGAFATPTAQIGRIVSGSTTVVIGGKLAATQGSQATMCVAPATAIVPSVLTVLIG